MIKPACHYPFLSVLLLLCLAGQGWAGVTLESRFTDERDAQPGDTYRGTIALRNTDDTPSEAKVYQTDYEFSAEKGILYGPPGQLTRSNAEWTSLSSELIVIPAHTAVSVDFEVRVPAGAGLSGTYWSVIMVDPISMSSQEAGAEGVQSTAQVRQTIRYAVQIVTHIGKTAAGELAFANPGLVIEGDKQFLAIDVANTGQRWLRPTLSLELYGTAGNPIGKFQGQVTRLYPGTSTRARIGLADIPKGKYLGLVVADGTGDNLFGANVELEIE